MTHLGPRLDARKVARRSRARAFVALLVSLAANVLLLRSLPVDFLRPSPEARQVELAPISAAEWETNRALQPAPSVKERDRTPRDAAKPVVHSTSSNGQEPPTDASYLAERNNRVEKETRSRHAAIGYERALPVPVAPAPGRERRESPEPAPGAAGDLSAPEPGTAPLPDAADGDVAQGNRAAGSGVGRIDDPRRLLPSARSYAQLGGGPPPDDLAGVALGEATSLNTREWKYATFINRVVDAIAKVWNPNLAIELRDPRDELHVYRDDKVTVVDFTLDGATGALKAISVKTTCGLGFLDDSAIEAVKRAQPFPNPPRGLVDGRGEIRIAQFRFRLVAGSGGAGSGYRRRGG